MSYEFRFVAASKINKNIYLHESRINFEAKSKINLMMKFPEKFVKDDHPTKNIESTKLDRHTRSGGVYKRSKAIDNAFG